MCIILYIVLEYVVCCMLYDVCCGLCTDYRTIISISRLSASLPIIGIGHLTIGIGRLFVLVSKTKKCYFTWAAKYRNGLGWAITKNYKLVKLRQGCYESTIIPL